MTTIQDRIIKDYGIKYQEVIGDLVDSAIDVGSKTSNNPLEIDLNPVKKLMPEFVQARTKIEQFLIQSIKEVEEETRKEITDDLGKLMDIDRARKLGDNLEIYQGKRECPICGANPEKQREMILSITNKEVKK
jgi:hypothetical protein